MTAGIEAILVGRPPRSQAGSIAANRFDYQKNWVVVLLLSLHESDSDYLIACDYHEDVLVFDSESNPSRVKLYQIKTRRKGNWTAQALLSRGVGKDGKRLSSILGNLISAGLPFGAASDGALLVSNAPFKLGVRKGDSALLRRITLSDLSDDEVQAIVKSLEVELATKLDASQLDRLEFELSEIPLDGHSTFAKGVVADFLDRLLGTSQPRTAPFYRAIFDEIALRTNFEGTCNSLEHFKAKKCVGRGLIAALLAQPARQDSEQLWLEINQRLVAEGASLPETVRLKAAWRTCEVRSMNAADRVFAETSKEVAEKLANAVQISGDLTLTRLQAEAKRLAPPRGGVSHDEIAAIGLRWLYEQAFAANAAEPSEEEA